MKITSSVKPLTIFVKKLHRRCWKPLIIFVKSSIFDAWQGFNYTSTKSCPSICLYSYMSIISWHDNPFSKLFGFWIPNGFTFSITFLVVTHYLNYTQFLENNFLLRIFSPCPPNSSFFAQVRRFRSWSDKYISIEVQICLFFFIQSMLGSDQKYWRIFTADTENNRLSVWCWWKLRKSDNNSIDEGQNGGLLQEKCTKSNKY